MGFEPESKAGKRNKQRRQRKKHQENSSAVHPEEGEEERQEPANVLPEDAVKKVKAIEKKLRQIASLKEKQRAGATLDPDQLNKIAAEADLHKQLQMLKV